MGINRDYVSMTRNAGCFSDSKAVTVPAHSQQTGSTSYRILTSPMEPHQAYARVRSHLSRLLLSERHCRLNAGSTPSRDNRCTKDQEKYPDHDDSKVYYLNFRRQVVDRIDIGT